VIAPHGVDPVVVGPLQREVGHERRRGGAVPVLLAGLELHRVARPDRLDGPAAALGEPGAFGDVEDLAVRMRVPGGARAGREVDAQQPHLRPGDRVDPDLAGEPLGRATLALGALARDPHQRSSAPSTPQRVSRMT
jgi:hypothetical protein